MALDCCPVQKQAAAGKLAGRGTLSAHEARYAAGTGITKNCFCGPASQLKHYTFQTLKSLIVHENVEGFSSQPWKGMAFYAVQCFRLLYSDWRSTFLAYLCQAINVLDVAMRSIKCHEQIDHSIQLNHFNN